MNHTGLSPLPQDLTLAEMSDVQIRAIVGELINIDSDDGSNVRIFVE